MWDEPSAEPTAATGAQLTSPAAAVSPLRDVLGSHLGQVITPVVAATIEAAAGRSTSPYAQPGRIDRLAATMIELPPAVCTVRHFFSPGIYAREITIPKGVTLIGAMHRGQNMAILSRGRLQLVTDNGTIELRPGDPPVNCRPGRQNAAYAIEESVWTNFFHNPANETDPDRLVEMVACIKASELLGGPDNPQTLAMARRESLEV